MPSNDINNNPQFVYHQARFLPNSLLSALNSQPPDRVFAQSFPQRSFLKDIRSSFGFNFPFYDNFFLNQKYRVDTTERS